VQPAVVDGCYAFVSTNRCRLDTYEALVRAEIKREEGLDFLDAWIQDCMVALEGGEKLSGVAT